MKNRLMDIIRCPVCRNQLNLQIFSEKTESVAVSIRGPRCSTFCSFHNVAPKNGIQGGVHFDCRNCYERNVREGYLLCPLCKRLYPIIEGVPRLIRNADEEFKEFFFFQGQKLANLLGSVELRHKQSPQRLSIMERRSKCSFSLQWRMYQYQDKTWFKDDLELRRREFLYSMDLTEESLSNRLILDAGCGNGKLTASVSQYGAEVVGMDLSTSVERAAENCQSISKEHSPFVHFVQGDIMEPPFLEGAFDHIHASGVLHHTPDPWRAFKIFITLVRPGGRVYVQLYRKREAWVRISNQVIRFFTTRMPVKFLYWICYQMVPLHMAAVLIVAFFRGESSKIRESNRRERTLSLFDNLSPPFQFRYTPSQVQKMFEDAGLKGIKDVTLPNEARHMIAFLGEKVDGGKTNRCAG